ncbi:unnamed protein product [Cladocopium goreaui]|uniref:Uncharacterized protein n=1 Tax=Cladocopium goreaui TaxID=2562237 RepID=A0A9P1C9X7_9DINO|nr:unnamed protein product [Cladocopium goreaui]
MTKKGQLQNCNLMKHHKSKAHKAAVKEWLKEGGCVGPSPDAALALSQFQELMECFGEKRSLTQKELQMAWCLAEGLKALDQTFIAKSSHISLMRDERHGRLAIRFMAVAPDLTTRRATWVFQLTQAAAAEASATEAWLLRPNRLAVSASKGFEKTDCCFGLEYNLTDWFGLGASLLPQSYELCDESTMETSDVAASAIDETTWLHRPYHGCIGRVAASAIDETTWLHRPYHGCIGRVAASAIEVQAASDQHMAIGKQACFHYADRNCEKKRS